MKATDSLLRGINMLIQRAIKNAPYDYSKFGIIQTVYGSNVYGVVVADKTYKLVSVAGSNFSVGTVVIVRFPENNSNLAYIESIAPNLSLSETTV